ncbi:hypothetical protein [Halalkalibacillus halophilus]|uniref:hypothetical protein n=1 Tax=Halalkalibacillus halophilus TaxID=392827 RepID=UPI0003F87738|nr:hypothetical protein [Halalkalibacillus halophilus]
MEANRKWMALPKDIRNRLKDNVFCGNCSGATTIVNFIVEENEAGIILQGECKHCGKRVARVVEMDS